MTAYDLWRPVSGCGPACLPSPGVVPGVPAAVRARRLVALLGMLVAGAVLAVLLPVLPTGERQAAVRGWARRTARAAGVRLVVRGRPPRRRALLVANHESWLDVLAVLAVAPAAMVAKSEVRGWPLLGRLAGAAGTLFVDRARPRDLPDTVARVAAALRAGRSVAVFPEGTTWCGDGGCRPGGGFRPAVFQAAVDAGAPVVPLRIGYRCAATGAGTTAAAFLGEENLWRSVRRVLGTRRLVVEVTVTATLYPARNADRRVLARAAEAAVHLVPSPPRLAAAPAGPPSVPGPTGESAAAVRELGLAA
ncbi:lysophospholipid acyltransferase family protein [Micromonospora endolithica]|uniref:1-acyl-sn-glycerol-3-phosphate acyltransferase n=1 Tax=Micromonospora endolithica TaxID=230091 RepID=A0A3A9YW00_9ACTN|nr:lysophospholipid acyltransferase family protein [Micromonospora endolithica]RKN39959.1 1-acyl-sn-glycerol-3-phosphate acyltransferase [Micromonospora endolithica]TWJ26127.1 1-acyl-sn-glycerol-3-phosphate acyltransferase [Micromonospora endolithica]